MPLPEPNSPWPPRDVEVPYSDIERWAAWWAGDPEVLTRVYGGGHNTAEQSWSERGGLRGAFQRWFWGQPTPEGEQRSKLHLPVAAEVAQVSADMVFGQPPQITVDEEQDTQDRIDELMGEALHTQLYDACEAGSALGHNYLRVGWDLEIEPDGPLFSTIDADAAYPRYQYNRLTAVTFCREFKLDGGKVLRHLEHHELGLIEHAVYLGDTRNLGHRVALEEHPETVDLVDSLTVDPGTGRTGVLTGLKRLDVIGVANARSRTWRHLPNARDMGRADISGVEPELDALDDVWSSWMRDVAHGRSRIHVPQHYLESMGPGRGATVNLNRSLYVGLNAMTDSDRLELTATQFAIRWQEHAETSAALIERIVSGAGYSPQTFGLHTDTALTATESWAQQTRTQNTRNSKIRRWRPAIIQLTQLMLEVDRIHFQGKADPSLIPEVTFPATVSESQNARAQTAAALAAANLASKATLVEMLHPDWDDELITEEVELIFAEERAKQPIVVQGPGDPTDEDLANGDAGDDEQERPGEKPDSGPNASQTGQESGAQRPPLPTRRRPERKRGGPGGTRRRPGSGRGRAEQRADVPR